MVRVSVDENVVDKSTLNVIQQQFDEDLFDFTSTDTSLRSVEDKFTEEEIGYMNYAKYAAMHKIGLESEFITLDKGHTKAIIDSDDFEYDFDE